jgi:hypothetical protein
MQSQKLSLSLRVFLLVGLLSLCCFRATAQTSNIPARITQAVDDKNIVVMRGNIHPLARPEFDQGVVPDAQPMQRMLLLLQRSPDQEAALRQLLDDQQSKSSPNYRSWLTPEQFGKQFGPADADIQAITTWLQSQGFQVSQVTLGRTVVEFSGNATQVRNAFHTDIHRFVIDGKEYTANASDSQIPAALAPVVAGIVSLHDFPRKSHARILGQFSRTVGKPGLQPLFTFPNPFNGRTFYGLGPGDFATIYNSKPLIAAGNDGTGQTIAIVGETNLNVQDVQQFRKMFGLPANFDTTNVVLNGEDPGITSFGEEGEADLDVEWSGAVAPGATVKFVVSASTPASAGIDLSAIYIVEHNLAGVMSESYGECEKNLGAAGNAFYNSLWEQAAAQGITVVISSGDGGSAGCDNFDTEQVATQGLAVSGLASTPFNVSVGGTDFDEVNNWPAYWNSTNDPTGTSAKSYIPEIPWNQNCAQIGLTGCGPNAPNGSVNIVAGSGGASTFYGKPKWQVGVTGMPNDSHRDQPDVSLFASPGFDGTGYVYCQSDRTISGAATCDINASGGVLDFGIVGGTSASAPAFAGIMALVNQKQATATTPAPRQGNANYVLYALAKKAGASCNSSVSEAAGCVFNDVTKGNSFLPTGLPGVGTNSVPCQGGSLNCSVSVAGNTGVLVDPSHTTTEAWTATTGYDMTTGLGTVNANNLAINWGSVSTIPTTTTLTLSPTTGITHGTGESVTVGITVKPNTGTGVPAGDVSLIATPIPADGTTRGLDQFTLVNAAISGTKTHSLPGGTYNVSAHYAGDGINAPSDSMPVQVSVTKESSQTFIWVAAIDSNGNSIPGNATSLTYGSQYIIRMYVTDKNGAATMAGPPSPTCYSENLLTCPTGIISLTADGSPINGGAFALNNQGYTRDLVPALMGGTYPLIASYLGDASYSTSTSATATLTINPAPTSQQWVNYPSFGVVGQQFPLAIAIGTGVAGVSPTGTVTFYDGNTPLPGTVTYNAQGQGSNVVLYANLTTSISTGGSHTLSAKYSGDANYGPSTTSPVTIVVKYPTLLGQSESATNINYGQSVTVTAIVTGNSKGPALAGQVQFFGTTTPINGPVTTASSTDASGNPILKATVSTTPQYSEQISVSYNGDPNYTYVTTTGDFVTVNIPDFSISPNNGFSLTVTAGQSTTTNITVMPLSQTPSTVALNFNGGTQALSGYSLTAAPQTLNLNGAPLTAVITLAPSSQGTAATAARSSTKRSSHIVLGRTGWWTISGAAALAMALLLGIFDRKPRYRIAFALGLVCAFSFALGCGGGAGGGGGGGGGGPVPTSVMLTTSNAKVASGVAPIFTATVTSTKPVSGTITFFAGNNAFSGPVPLTNGQAQFSSLTFQPGVYQFTATYSGDGNNQASTSPPLLQIFTGTVFNQLTAQTGGLTHAVPVNLTLQ